MLQRMHWTLAAQCASIIFPYQPTQSTNDCTRCPDLPNHRTSAPPTSSVVISIRLVRLQLPMLACFLHMQALLLLWRLALSRAVNTKASPSCSSNVTAKNGPERTAAAGGTSRTATAPTLTCTPRYDSEFPSLNRGIFRRIVFFTKRTAYTSIQKN